MIGPGERPPPRGTINRFGLILAAALLVCPGLAAARDDEALEPRSDLVHADTPLWGFGDDIQPYNFTDGDDFGCLSRIAYGDWTIQQAADADAEPEWMRLTNYGVFHCAIVERSAHDRDHLDRSAYRYSFFVHIGDTKRGGKPLELWVLQSGTRPGSDYLLLARTPAEEIIKSFDVLQRECPLSARRTGLQMDIWRTDYCSINSRGALIAFAKAMARKPPLARLAHFGEPPEDPAATEQSAEAVSEP